jgi:hypothetical protein
MPTVPGTCSSKQFLNKFVRHCVSGSKYYLVRFTCVRVSSLRGMAAVSVIFSCWNVAISSRLCSSCSAASARKKNSI